MYEEDTVPSGHCVLSFWLTLRPLRFAVREGGDDPDSHGDVAHQRGKGFQPFDFAEATCESGWKVSMFV